jgi:hypothetical protein
MPPCLSEPITLVLNPIPRGFELYMNHSSEDVLPAEIAFDAVAKSLETFFRSSRPSKAGK